MATPFFQRARKPGGMSSVVKSNFSTVHSETSDKWRQTMQQLSPNVANYDRRTGTPARHGRAQTTFLELSRGLTHSGTCGTSRCGRLTQENTGKSARATFSICNVEGPPERPLRRIMAVGRALPILMLLAGLFGYPIGQAIGQETSQPPRPAATSPSTDSPAPHESDIVADPRQVGGEPDSIVQVANLVYAGVKSSQCFSDHFLVAAEKQSAISTSRRFHAVKLNSEELFDFPLVIMTGEGSFELTDAERQNLRQFVDRGGFLLASAGCSSADWNRSFRHEMAAVFPEQPLTPIGMDHPLFDTVYHIDRLRAKHGTPRPLEGITIGGRLGVVYSQDGLNDTAHTQGCCCCGGNEITNSVEVNVNILAYALIF